MKKPIRKELLDELLAEYANPEDLTGQRSERARVDHRLRPGAVHLIMDYAKSSGF